MIKNNNTSSAQLRFCAVILLVLYMVMRQMGISCHSISWRTGNKIIVWRRSQNNMSSRHHSTSSFQRMCNMRNTYGAIGTFPGSSCQAAVSTAVDYRCTSRSLTGCGTYKRRPIDGVRVVTTFNRTVKKRERERKKKFKCIN